jgi:uncharacterized membrane protein
MKRSILAALVLTWVAFCLEASAQLPLRYSLTDLGTFGGTSAVATAINNSGQVVGLYASGGTYRCFYWESAGFGTTTWGSSYPNGYCAAYAIGDNGAGIAGTLTR